MLDLNTPCQSAAQPGPASRSFECNVCSSGRAATWIRACGELDLRSEPRCEEALQAGFSGAQLLIVDLRQLSSIDSTGLHLIITADARARRARRLLMFVRRPAPIDRLLNILGLSDRLEILDLKSVLVAARALVRHPADLAQWLRWRWPTSGRPRELQRSPSRPLS